MSALCPRQDLRKADYFLLASIWAYRSDIWVPKPSAVPRASAAYGSAPPSPPRLLAAHPGRGTYHGGGTPECQRPRGTAEGPRWDQGRAAVGRSAWDHLGTTVLPPWDHRGTTVGPSLDGTVTDDDEELHLPLLMWWGAEGDDDGAEELLRRRSLMLLDPRQTSVFVTARAPRFPPPKAMMRGHGAGIERTQSGHRADAERT